MSAELILKTIVIDDEPLALGLIESYVAKTPFLEQIASFTSAVEAVHSPLLAEADLLFLDIQMPTLNGLEFSKMVSAKTRIVFTTAFDQYALDGYKVNALDYLLKPISYLDFLEAANKALSWFELVSQVDSKDKDALLEQVSGELDVDGVEQMEDQDIDCIYVKADYKLLRIDLSELLYIEGLKDYVKFYIESQNTAIISLMSIKKAMDLLPEKHFIRVNRSYVVRKDKIKAVERGRILVGDKFIPIGDAYKQELQTYLKVRSL